MDWTVPAVPGEVGRLRTAVCAFAREHGLPERRMDDVALAVTEIVTNAVVHAYRGRSEEVIGQIEVSAEWRPEGLRVSVCDDGVGLSPRADSPGAGLGMAICNQIAAVDYSSRPRGGTRVELVFA